MTKKILPANAYIADTQTVKGRGIYSSVDFNEGDLIEEVVVIVLMRPYDQLPAKLQRVVYNWGALTQSEPCSALCLGFGSLYNHANPANMRYTANKKNQTLSYYAARNIKEGEELTVNYNAGYGSNISKEDDWFERNNITPIN